jgi:3-hydroxyisobutyrate dehydrogenase-like beta-hydroxyacid dehydrogenase
LIPSATLKNSAADPPRQRLRYQAIQRTSLPSLAAVDAAFFGKGGIVASAKRGTVIIETSTRR